MTSRVHTLLALTLIDDLGPTKLKSLITIKGSAIAALKTYPLSVRKSVLDKALKVHKRVSDLGGRIVSFHCPEYPFLLKNISDPPGVIYLKGNIPKEISRAIAVVGTRKCSPEGKRFAELSVKHMAKQNWPLVSGLALGIDTAAHNMAIKMDLPSVAVLAHGFERIHPICNESLANEILRHGGAWISEHPPGTKVLKWMFAARNRILVGLCSATVLAESPEKGGSMISLKLALNYNRGTYAFLPPNAYENRWNGNRYIIAQNQKNAIKTIPNWHNQLISEIKEMAVTKEEQRLKDQVAEGVKIAGAKIAPERCQSLYMELSRCPKSPYEISKILRTDVKTIRTRLFILESLQMVKREPGDCYSLL